jgi:AcrR family transcriptional regulator
MYVYLSSTLYEMTEEKRRAREPRARSRRARPATRESIWSRPEPSTRRPAHTRDGIARAAIRIADAEGFEALSMRRVARELGAGTMTLYHYVRTKEELLSLVDNAVMGELLIPPDELPEGWRAGMREIAHRTRAVFVRHPWVVDMPKNVDDGPNGALHFEQSLSVMAETGLPIDECLELVILVDDYVFGYVQRFNPMDAFAGADPEAVVDAFADEAVARLAALDAGSFPSLRALIPAGEEQATFARLLRLALDPDRFERGLDLVLDGIERRVQGAGGKPLRG